MTVKLSGPVVFGSMSDDVQDGTDLGDVFVGGYGWMGDAGDDAVYGYGGDDTIFGSDGADTLDGGAGSDLVDYSQAAGPLTVDLGKGTATLVLDEPNSTGSTTETDTLVSIERVRGSAFDDSIVGSSGDDVLAGGAGNDTLDGGIGFDTASFAAAAGPVNASLVTGQASAADGTDVLRNFEHLVGSAFGDTLTGDGGANLLDGGAGNDVLRGGAGNDTLAGGTGDDTAVFSGQRSQYAIVTLADGRVTVSDLQAGRDGSDTLSGIRHLQFSDQKVDLTAIDALVAAGAQAQSVTGLADGSYVIAWQGADADGSGIFFRRFDTDGTPLGAVGQVNTATAGQQTAPVIAALYDGGWVTVYQTAQAATAGGWDVALQRFNADGTKNGGEVVLGAAGDQLAPGVTATVDGGFAVSWHAASADGTTDVRVARFGWDGQAQGNAAVNTTVAGNQGAAAIAEQDNGYMVAWQSDNGASHGVLVQQFRWDGEAIGEEVTLATTGVVGSVGIATLYGDEGTSVSGTVVGWIQDDGNAATADDAVMVQRFDATGAPVGSPVTVASAGFQHEAAVTGLRDGGFIVVWDSVAADGTTTVMGRHYDADGNPAGAAWQANQVAVTGTVSTPTVAEAADGRVVVSWTTTAGGTSRVWHQMVDVDGAAEFAASSSTGQPPATPHFTVQAADEAGSTSAAAAHPQGAGAPVIDEGKFDTGNLLVTGTSDPGAAVTLYDAGAEVARVTADAGGKWSVALADLKAGPHSFHAVAVDALGQASTASKLVVLTVLGTLEGTAGHDDAAYFAALGADGTDQSFDGGAGNDTIDGGGGADTLAGGTGDDTFIVGNAGVTIVEQAGGGTDTVLAGVDVTLAANVENLVFTGTAGRTGHGNAGNNALTGTAGNDALYGGEGNDTLSGGAGNDTLDGGTGADVLAGGDGNDRYVVDATGDFVTESAAASGGIDTVQTTLASYTLGTGVEHLVRTGTAAFTGIGNTLDNDIAGSAGNDRLDGGAGNDTLRGNGGQDELSGGAGNDTIYAGNGSATIDGGEGTDTLYLARALGEYTRSTTGGVLTLTGPDGAAIRVANVERFSFAGGAPVDLASLTVSAAPVNQNLKATDGADALAGGAGNDTLDGGVGNDTLTGGAGDDTYIVDAVGDRIVELADQGTDEVKVAITTRNATWQLDANVENATITSTAAVSLAGNDSDNYLKGNGAANTLTGGAGDDTLDGAGGADKLDGGAGDDTYVVDVAGDKVVESAGNGHDTVLTSLATLTLGANVEDLRYTGSAKATLTGNAEANEIINGNGGGKLSGLAGNDTLAGGTGNDSLIGGDGNDELRSGGGNDTLDGGAGLDTAVLAGDRAAWTVKRTADRALELSNGTDKVVVRDVEQFTFADGTVAFDAMAVSTTATSWSDALTGTAGDDTLDGKAGADTMAGLAGNDTYVVDSKDDVVVEAAGGGEDTVQVAIATAKTTYVLADNVEHAKVTSKAIINVTGNAAANALTGNAAANALSGLDGNDTLDGAAGNDVLDGGNGDDSLLGGAGNDKLEGGAGSDWLDGGAGSDTLAGGAGDDVYVVDANGDRVTEAANEGIDTVRTSLAKYTLGAEVERLVYTGGAAFAGTGNALANFIEGGAKADKLAGGDGDDTLSGHAGNDTLDGGEGNDTAVFDGAQADYDVQVTATDIVLTGLGAKIVLKGVEMLAFSDRTLALSDMLVGIATPGNDSLTGTSGADTLDGKAGADTMTGLAGDDSYIVDHAGDRIVETAGAGVDVARIAFAAANGTYVLDANVEDAIVTNKVATHVTGNDGANTLTGNAAVNTLAGAGGNDSLYGQAGNDKLDGGAGDDLLDGGAGNDTLAGGTGDDVYVVDSKSDSVIELAGEGSDTVQTALAAYTLAANVENLFFTGTAAFTGTGNDLDNLITGGRGNDRLLGGAGNDTLAGGAGKDTLTGGDGNDVFRLDLATADTVTDYKADEDTVSLDVTGLALGGGIVQWAATGGFASEAGLVVFEVNAKTLDAKGAAAAIGSAASAYADDDVALFAIDNGVSTAVFKFVSDGADALVSANELTQVATLTGVKDATLVDFALFHA